MNILLYRGEAFDPNFYYYAGVDIDHAVLLQQGNARTLLVPRMNEAQARKTFRGSVCAYRQFWEELKKRLQGKTVEIDGQLPYAFAQKLKRFCRIADASERLMAPRMKKRKDEITAIAKATRVTREILDGLELESGMQESEVKKQLLRATLERGSEPAFEPIVATAANAKYPHYRGGNARIRDMVLIDYGVKHGYYSSDVTRCFFLRKNTKMEDAYEKCKEVSEELLDGLPMLHTGTEVAEESDRLMKKHGLPPLIHSIGHGVGLEVHEGPRLGKKSKDRIADTVMAIEPAAYYARFGVRYENTVYFDGKRARIL